MRLLGFIIFALCVFNAFSQQKQLEAFRINTHIKIDGILDESEWDNAKSAQDFIQYAPFNGKPASQHTEVKILYDNNAIYVGAYLYDTSPDSILKELCKRDDSDANTDNFSIDITPFDDGINAFSFKITAAGVQIDEKFSANGSDENWNAVWQSNVTIDENGWFVEMKIPYSAIRFPKKDIHVWGINFWRNIRRKREFSTWNYVDNKKENVFTQSGNLINIQNITPPLRLSFMPYISSYIEKTSNQQKWGYSFNGGMDVKCGLNESFTLDMTLIPDFGQVESDDIVLNLTPFEIYYEEKRSFFTEGTELFEKGDIFYTRRIADEPINYYSAYNSLDSNEIVIHNPSKTHLINATKISGRTNKGLGVGFFNGMTSNTFADIEDTILNIERKELTQAFTNYNMIVFDQSLWGNSYISFVNTNVKRQDYMADVFGSVFELVDKSNDYGISGSFLTSQRFQKGEMKESGYHYKIEAGKMSGNLQYGFETTIFDDKFDPNDMGYLDVNNSIENDVEISYHIFDPFWKIINLHNSLSVSYNLIYNSQQFESMEINYNTHTTFKNYLSMGINMNANPVESNDFYEARTDGRIYKSPKGFYANLWLSPDYRKKFVIDIDAGFAFNSNQNATYSWGSASPRIRLSNKMMLIFSSSYSFAKNNRGFATNINDTIYFGERDIPTFTNTISMNYIFNNKSSLSYRFRHYFTAVENSRFLRLENSGYLTDSDYEGNHDISFNALTFDLSYTWYFAAGSELSLVWKNAIFSSESENIVTNYYDNLQKTFEMPQTNSLSFKIIYYIDYQYIFKKSDLKQ
ncbi:MAG: hypothetical protein A2W98_06950 [Bacteroidetes bacterium GWF2_33_38]|nr:MAG: hypothetical protein A2W98_06950 [Bacteroidetes bacterium GWF2_33_38]OFY76180.1 MAG: hypothetical protein A2265_09620 [Bacteroidetes bacterium RIFOXYA12_FULL_33_9]OFY90538.1 MAG: hypothetical protein A2236_05625 [Bacteroidetes bacterium RIFOXYA2_FULL_33_7]